MLIKQFISTLKEFVLILLYLTIYIILAIIAIAIPQIISWYLFKDTYSQ